MSETPEHDEVRNDDTSPEGRTGDARSPGEPECVACGKGPEQDVRRGEIRATWFFAASAIASIALAAVYWSGGQTQAEGVLLAVMFGGIGFAIVNWARHAMPHDEVVEERHSVASTDEEIEEFTDDLERGAEGIGRRRALLVAAGSAVATMAAALVFPIRSLGPRPGKGLKETPYAGHPKRVVTADGKAVRPSDIAVDGIVTVWPEGHLDAADAPTLLIRTRPTQKFVAREGRDDWRVDDIVAYSKLCTHVGCPVGLYQAESGLLLCPCHQSTFEVLDGARPIFGPATRSLPQLPLALNDDGELIATGDFSSPVGPGFWDRDRGRK